jgi:creatinine amidohydrolase
MRTWNFCARTRKPSTVSDSQPPTWAQGLEILRVRHREAPEHAARALTCPLDFSRIDLAKYRSVVTTGIGSSLAHARYLSWLLRTRGNIPSWDVSSGAFVAMPGNGAREQALVVFSQGFSPNARLPLAYANRFGCTIVITAAGREPGERAEALKRAEESGVIVIPMPLDPEYEVLLRLAGPVVGYAMALRLAAHCGIPLEIDPRIIASAMTDASSRADALISAAEPALFSDPITFVATGGYGSLASNLSSKVTEGMFLPPPVIVDALEFAHGVQQEATGKRRTFIGLRRDAPSDAALFARVRATLAPQQRWVEFQAHLSEPFQIFEHEAGMNALVLAAIAARQLDQREWPGKGLDQPLYGVASVEDIEAPLAAVAPAEPARRKRLEDLTWREIESRIGDGETTVVIPLGATEQHGPHLPLRIDSLIADALAERFCDRVPEAIQAPTVEFGCSSEHMDFCGTLSLSTATLGAVLEDLISSLVRHGYRHVVVFSAHGGNYGLFQELQPKLTASAAPACLTVVQGIDRLGKVFADASAVEGVSADASGAHAGEFETSIIAALRPDLIRWQQLEAGTARISEDSQTLFYPSLRNNAPNGVVGDPGAASGERAERYLSAWVNYLIAAYEETKHAARVV